RAPQGHRHLHVTHRGAAAHALRQRAREGTRSRLARARVLRRRSAERAGVGVVPERGAWRPGPGHRSLLADRDRWPGRRQSLRDRAAADQTGLRRSPPRRRRGRGRRSGRPRAPGGRERHLRDQAAVPRSDRATVGGTRALREGLLGEGAGQDRVLHLDATSIDEDGYVWFSGRADEIIKIADHRIGTIEVETAFLRNPAVAEAGVTGRPDALRGQVISAFIVLKQGREPSEQLRKELVATVRNELGPLAVIGELNFVDMLPKTRSGKIMRRVLKAVILEKDPGDISTIEDEGSVEEAREAWQQMKTSVAAGD